MEFFKGQYNMLSNTFGIEKMLFRVSTKCHSPKDLRKPKVQIFENIFTNIFDQQIRSENFLMFDSLTDSVKVIKWSA